MFSAWALSGAKHAPNLLEQFLLDVWVARDVVKHPEQTVGSLKVEQRNTAPQILAGSVINVMNQRQNIPNMYIFFPQRALDHD